MPDRWRFARVLSRSLLILACGTLVACGSNAPAPVEDRNVRAQPPRVQTFEGRRSYRVQRGDTLYSIAFRYGLDYRKVAAANRIPAPYTIYVGQDILLREGSLAAASAPQPAPVATPPAPAPRAPSTPAPATQVRTVATPATPAYADKAVSAWRWPTRGRVTRGYSGSVHKGIDIDGRRGDPVVAVADGKVVYAGTGIVGFGELLIVKHNDVYLSAYGHNDRLLVTEGQVVSAGQQIAEKGSSGTDSVKLHFEIRKEGKPVDPQRLLPRR
jgi:lipoprotein NlpD